MVKNRFSALAFSALLCTAAVHPLSAGISDWFSSMSPRAQAAKRALEDFDARVEKSLKEYEVPGIAIGVIVDGQVVYSKAFGVRDLEKKQPVTPDTLFAIGSLTKGFTSFLTGLLVDEGALEWDAQVSDLLPEFRLYDNYATHHMTLRDLLTHRSGMPRHDYMWYNSKLTRKELMQRLRYLEPASELRERYHYNNLMYLTAGYVIEQITKKSWEDLISQRIFTPLEMKSSLFSIDEVKKSSNFASPHLQKENKLIQIGFRDISVIGPAGSIYSNIPDLIHWVQMHLNQGIYNDMSLINQSTLQEMHSPQVIISGTPEHEEVLFSTYGIGWDVLSYRGHYLVGHDGGTDGFTSWTSLLPKDGIGLIILSNKNLTPLPRFLAAEIMDRVLGLPFIDWYQQGLDTYLKGKESQQKLKLQEDLTRKKGTRPSHPLEEYVREYEHPGYGQVNVQKVGNELKLTFNYITSSLKHWHYDVFVVSEESEDLHLSRVGTKLTFHTNLNGEIDELAIPFEPGTADVLFKKNPSNEFASRTYLQKFVGLYEGYGVSINISIKDHHLIATIPGQPVYELLPEAANEFTIKSKIGQTVRFVLDDNGLVEEALLIQPFGAFSAKPKR